MKRFLPFLLLLASCGNYKTIEVQLFVDDDNDKVLHPDSDVEGLLYVASRNLGYRIVPVRRAPIRIELIETGAPVQGRAWRYGLCNGNIRSTFDPLILAHEMGHLLNLDHVDSAGNLMESSVRGPDLTVTQRRRMRRRAKDIENLCWDNTEPQERSAAPGAGARNQPEQLCSESALGGQREEAEHDVGTEQAPSSTGDEAGAPGVRGDGSSTGWSVFFEWMRH